MHDGFGDRLAQVVSLGVEPFSDRCLHAVLDALLDAEVPLIQPRAKGVPQSVLDGTEFVLREVFLTNRARSLLTPGRRHDL